MSSGGVLPHEMPLAAHSVSESAHSARRTTFNDWIKKDGLFPPEKDRYHLYICYTCPWATRTLIFRKLKGLEDFIGVTILSPCMDSEGWPFANFNDFPGAENDPFHPESKHLRDVYLRVDPAYAGRFSVPLLWDKKTSKIVNNESSEIIRMFNDAFNDLLPKEKADIDLRPEALRAEVDELVDWMQDAINIGVYKVGFVKEQQAYETAVTTLFEALDRVEKLLEGKDYLIGNQLTEADIRLFVTIVRFDPVYVGLFKCNIRTIRDGYPNIHLWMRKLYWNNPVFKDTCLFDHIKTGYYNSHNFTPIELPRIVPKGPVPDILPL